MAKSTRHKSNGSNGIGILNERQMVHNATLMRSELIKLLSGDLQKDIDKECGYPTELTIDHYWKMWKREGIARRIISIYPEETWAMTPEIYDTESVAEETPFEAAWKALNERFHVLSKLESLDILSGIGQFGVMLLGLSDGRELKLPVEGTNELGLRSQEATALELLYLQVFSQKDVEIKTIVTDIRNPRYGKPEMYRINLLQPEVTGQSALGSTPYLLAPNNYIDVHWTRIIHAADLCESSDVLGTPRLEAVYNRAYDLRKILGADGEGYWKNGFPGLSIETQPGIENPEFEESDKQAAKQEIEEYMNSTRRYLALVGFTARPITALVSDPGPHFSTHMLAISVTMGVPLRIFLGSEEAKQASNQDARTWNKRLNRRQYQHNTPRIVRPTIDRFIGYGVLPVPLEGKYIVGWPDLNAPTENDRANTAQKITDALVKYVQNGVAVLMGPKHYLIHVMLFSTEEVESFLEAAGGEKVIMEKLGKMLQPKTPKEGAQKKTKKVGVDEGVGPA